MKFLKIKSLVINLDKIRKWDIIPKAIFWPSPDAPKPDYVPIHPNAATPLHEASDEFGVVISVDGEKDAIRLAPPVAKAFVAHMKAQGYVEEIEIAPDANGSPG
jgi:hypothetical protein